MKTIGFIQCLFAIHLVRNGLYGHLFWHSRRSELVSKAAQHINPSPKTGNWVLTIVALTSLVTAVVLNTRANWRAFFAGGGRTMRESLGVLLVLEMDLKANRCGL